MVEQNESTNHSWTFDEIVIVFLLALPILDTLQKNKFFAGS